MNNDVIFIPFLGIGDKNHFSLNFRNYQIKWPKIFLLSHRSVNTARLLVDGHQHIYVAPVPSSGTGRKEKIERSAGLGMGT